MAVKAQKNPSLLGPDWSLSWARAWREGACEASGARLLLLPFDIPPHPPCCGLRGGLFYLLAWLLNTIP